MIRPNQPNMLVDRFAQDKDAIRAQLTKAITAIQKYAERKEEESNAASGTLELLAEPETVTISFSLNTIPVKKDYRFHEILVPHNIIDTANQSVCLLVRDPKEKAVEQVKANGLPVEKVIAVKSLKKKYVSHASRKELANRFNVFMCEAQIFDMLGKLLGKYFFETKKSKLPIPLKNLSKDTLDKALRTARFRVRGGVVVGVRVGNRNMTAEQLTDNAMAVVEFMASKYCVEKKTFNNIYNIAVGATNVIDLPVWSVPVAEVVSGSVEEAPASVAVSTPKAEEKKAAPAKKPVSDNIAEVPLKQLKQLQHQRVEKAKQQLQSSERPKRQRK